MKEYLLPDVGEGITEAEIIRWLVQPDDSIEEHQDLVEIETDKAVVTLPSPYSGRVAELRVKEGDVVAVGEALLTIEESMAGARTAPGAKKDSGSVVGSLVEAAESESSGDIKAIPAVRAYAKELGVDLATVQGSGPGGRIRREDIERAAGMGLEAADRQDPYGPVESIPLRGIRRTVARQLAAAHAHVVPVTIWEDADITELARIRAAHKPRAARQGIRLTYLPYVIKAVVRALRAHPYLNASLDDDFGRILLKKYYHIGIAVDTADGLMVFVIRHADRKSLLALARDISELAEKSRIRNIGLHHLRGSTFTITNYGVIGASYGTPIINHPEVGILGIGKIEDKPLARSGEIVIRKVMPLSLAFDHRVIDGVGAARFLNQIIQCLEKPGLLLEEEEEP